MIQYNVNKEKRTIVATFKTNNLHTYLYESLYGMAHNIFKGTKLLKRFHIFTYRLANKCIDNHPVMIGIAKCHPDDEWDENKGKILAKNRLLYKWEALKEDFLNKLDEQFYNDFTNVKNRLSDKLLGVK